jgi:glyoxylase-like metal-dependent hydrolase (beta-lactamase superfamily II)
MYGENTYLIKDEATGQMAVVDPGYYETDMRMDLLNNDNLKYLLLTHAHNDHFLAVPEYLKEYPDVRFVVPEGDLELLRKYGCPEPTMTVNDGDVITLGETELKVIGTPGHTGGGICFATDKVVFSGDTLFRLSVGRTDLETGDWDTLMKSIKEKLYTLWEDIVVYPGHGMETTIGFEKKANPFV